MSNEELIEFDNELVEMNDDTQSDNENEIIEVIPTDIPRENLSKILQKIDEACDIATKFDPNLQRSQIFHNNLQQICKPYRELQIMNTHHPKKQTLIENFVTKTPNSLPLKEIHVEAKAPIVQTKQTNSIKYFFSKKSAKTVNWEDLASKSVN